MVDPFSERVPWLPSIDIAAAWQLVEKLAEKGHRIASLVNMEDGRWVVHFTGHVLAIEKGFGVTAQEAICRGALEAVGAL